MACLRAQTSTTFGRGTPDTEIVFALIKLPFESLKLRSSTFGIWMHQGCISSGFAEEGFMLLLYYSRKYYTRVMYALGRIIRHASTLKNTALY